LNGLRWVVVFFSGLGAVLIGAAAEVANDNAWGVWAVALVVAAAGLAACRLPQRRLRMVRRLQAQLPTA
jgi:Flp pilus assembly protein TadB